MEHSLNPVDSIQQELRAGLDLTHDSVLVDDESSLAVSHGPPIHSESRSSMVGYGYVHVHVHAHADAGRCIFPYSSLAASTVVQAYFLFSLITPCCGSVRGPVRGLVVGVLLGHYNVKLTGTQPKGFKIPRDLRENSKR